MIQNTWSGAEHMIVLTHRAQGRQNVICSCGWACKRARARKAAAAIREHNLANMSEARRAREIARRWWSWKSLDLTRVTTSTPLQEMIEDAWEPGHWLIPAGYSREPAEYTIGRPRERGYDE